MAKNDIRGLKLDGQNWVFHYRISGRARRMLLGRAPLLIPADARRAAQHFAGLVAIGRDPGAERKAARIANRTAVKAERATGHEPDQIERVAKQYLKWHREHARVSTAKETTRVMAKEVLPHWRGRRLGEITRADVRKLVDRIADRGAPVGANRALASIKAFCNWAVSEDILTVSPAASIRPPAPEVARERTIGRFRARLGLAGFLRAWRVWRRRSIAGAHRPETK